MNEPIEDLKCGICFELLLDPTSLTCGHTICRYCLAQWWYRSKKKSCPQCRQEWVSLPKVNVSLRNTINTLYRDQTEERKEALNADSSYTNIMNKFEALGNIGSRSSRSNNNHNSLSWTTFCILFAAAIGLAVVISLGIQNFVGGVSEESLKTKALEHWTSKDVGIWVSSLGQWAKVYQQNFVDAGINGDLLQLFTNEELEDSKINMTTKIHQKKFLIQLDILKSTLPKSSFDMWSYKERKNEMAMFIMLGVREFPRSTLVYLFLFDYWDTFLPFFSCCVTQDKEYTLKQLLDLSEDPTIWQWLTFIPWVLFAPYGLIAKFASYFLEQHYWTSRVVIMHAFFMTLTEISKFPSVLSSAQARNMHVKIMKYFGFVLLSSLFFKLFWSFVPMFIADCIFYWMLYVSPFDAANRLIKRMLLASRRRNAQNNTGARVVEDSGWQFDINWTTSTTRND